MFVACIPIKTVGFGGETGAPFWASDKSGCCEAFSQAGARVLCVCQWRPSCASHNSSWSLAANFGSEVKPMQRRHFSATMGSLDDLHEWYI